MQFSMFCTFPLVHLVSLDPALPNKQLVRSKLYFRLKAQVTDSTLRRIKSHKSKIKDQG